MSIGVVTTPLVLGVDDYLGCCVCTIWVLTSNCTPYRCIDSTFWHSTGVVIAPLLFPDILECYHSTQILTV